MATKSTVGRPRQFDTGAVLDAAMELFWTRGYAATTTRALEQASGLSQSSLYNAFGSKAELLDAALDRYESQLTEKLLSPLETAAAGLPAIDQFFASVGEWLGSGKRGCMLINMMAEDGGQSEEISARTRAYRARVRVAFASALERAISANETTGSSEGRSHLLLSVVIGLNIAARGGAEREELEGMVEGVREQIASWRT